eukprot:5471529-Heterocapsa_arctica.AAC.1
MIAPALVGTWNDNGTWRDVERIITQSRVTNQDGRIRLDRACRNLQSQFHSMQHAHGPDYPTMGSGTTYNSLPNTSDTVWKSGTKASRTPPFMMN